jgi:dihydrolipoamide dehydrogenase
MCIIGGGVIGLELGMVYMKLGTKVTVVELTSQLLPGVDTDMVKVVQKHLKKGGADVRLDTKAVSVDKSGPGVKVTVEKAGKQEVIEAETLLVCVGFKPNSAGLGLEDVGVALDQRGHITVDQQLRTNVDGVYAIGDVTGGPYLAHKASAEGEVCAEVIAGHDRATDWRSIAAAIFTDPEIATAGMSETQAVAAGRNIKVGKFPFAASGRAMAVRETDGFIKSIIDADTNQVIGVGIVGPEASDLISEAALAIEMDAFAEDVALTIHPHPTLGEGMMESFKHAIGEAVHVMNKK